MKRVLGICSIGIFSGVLFIDAAHAQTDTDLRRRVDVLTEEVQKIRLGEAAPQADRSQYGFAPGASKIYRTEKGFSLGGYGEFLYSKYAEDTQAGRPAGKVDLWDALRVVTYIGYKFNENFLFNSELEYEHGSTGTGRPGSVSVEFAYLDYLWRPEINFRGGMLLMPVGLINEIHEPTTFLGSNRPLTERFILPTTWRENGVGVFGQIASFSYRSYVSAGLNASGFSGDQVLRGGRQNGAESNAETLGHVTRVDFTAVPGLLVGGSVYWGKATTQGAATSGGGMTVPLNIYDGHVEYKYRGWDLRSVAAFAFLDNIDRLNAARALTGARAIGSRSHGYYVSLGYDVLSGGGAASLTPFVRYENLNSQAEIPAGLVGSRANQKKVLTLGLNFKPIDQIVLKGDVELNRFDDLSGTDQLNLVIGYVF